MHPSARRDQRLTRLRYACLILAGVETVLLILYRAIMASIAPRCRIANLRRAGCWVPT